jgi:histidinol phosphatase-like enzyme (inositol monophosphatase family)
MSPLPSAKPLEGEVSARLEAAVTIARRAGAATLGWFNAPGLAVDEKADRSPVTVADREAEDLLRRELLGAFPDDAFLGEESGATPGRSGYEWVIDPIDGTKSFIRGVPLYATLVGCRRDGEGLLGVIVIPALDELVFAARGGGAWHVRGGTAPVPAHVSRRTALAESLLCTSDFASFAARPEGRAAGDATRRAVESACRIPRTWGDGYGYLLVATGRAEVMIDPLMNRWDAAAVETVVVEAGGRFTDWQGRPRIDAGEGLATNGLVHDAMLRLLADCRDSSPAR